MGSQSTVCGAAQRCGVSGVANLLFVVQHKGEMQHKHACLLTPPKVQLEKILFDNRLKRYHYRPYRVKKLKL